MNRRATPLLVFITLVAGWLRFADLGARPSGLFRDEAEKGYNAWAIATTGGALDLQPGGVGGLTPVWRAHPWMINVMGNRTTAIYHYADAPFVKIFGLNVASTRMASALVGTLTVLLIGIFAGAVWGRWAGAAAALALAVSPWHLPFSRWALEGIFVPFFLALALLGLHGADKDKKWGWPLAGAALGWMFYCYSGAEPFVAVWGLCIVVIYFKALNPKSSAQAALFALAVVLFLLPIVPTVLAQMAPGGASRMGRIAIWNEPGAGVFSISLAFIKNYFAHFSPRFLFYAGDANPRHGVPGLVGVLNPVDIIFVPLGVLWILQSRSRAGLALLAAVICGPIPAALTRDGVPHALRGIAMAAPLAVLAGLGMACALPSLVRRAFEKNPTGRVLSGAAFIAVLWAAAAGWNLAKYWTRAGGGAETRLAFNDGDRAAWAKVAAERKPGERLFVDARIPFGIYYELFFFKRDPREVARAGLATEGVNYFDGSHGAAKVRPGDWIIAPQASAPALDIDPARAAEIGEHWAAAGQFTGQ